MTNLKLFLASLSVLASTAAHATSPMMPYIPAEAFKYRCDVTVVAYAYRSNSGRPAKQWTSKAQIEIDNNAQWFQGENMKWNHKYAESNPNMPFMPEGRPVANSVHVKNTTVSIRFEYPREDGVTELSLAGMLYKKVGDDSTHSSGQAFGTFDDARLGAQVDTMEYNDKTGVSTSKKLTVRCEKL